MKKLLYLILLVAVFTGCDKKITAVEYNDAIIAEQAKIFKLVDEFNTSVDNDSLVAARAIAKKTVAQCDSSLLVLEKLGPYKDNAEFKDAAADVFKFYKGVFSKDYLELIDIYASADLNEDDLDRSITIQQDIADREAVLDDLVHKKQDEFAKRNNMKIEENAANEE